MIKKSWLLLTVSVLMNTVYVNTPYCMEDETELQIGKQ